MKKFFAALIVLITVIASDISTDSSVTLAAGPSETTPQDKVDTE